MIDVFWLGLDTGIENGHVLTQHFLLISLRILISGGDTRQVPLVPRLVVPVSIPIPFTICIYRVYLLNIAYTIIPWRVFPNGVRRVVSYVWWWHFLWAVTVQILVRTVLLQNVYLSQIALRIAVIRVLSHRRNTWHASVILGVPTLRVLKSRDYLARFFIDISIVLVSPFSILGRKGCWLH